MAPLRGLSAAPTPTLPHGGGGVFVMKMTERHRLQGGSCPTLRFPPQQAPQVVHQGVNHRDDDEA